MRHIIKRNGSIVAFSQDKITHAINKSFISVNKEDPSKIQNISNQVMAVIEVQFKEDHFPTVEEIQDIVEKILIKNGESEVAKSYILYRDQHQKMRNIENMFVDAEKTMNEYLKKADWRVNANANQGYSLGGLILNSAGKITANYWLSHIYSKEVGQAHRNGDYHIHDLDMFSGYCAGWSLRQLLEEGFNGVANKIDSCPPKHLEAAIGQMVNFLGTLQNEWAGAQAFSSFDTYLAPYVRKIKNSLKKDLKDTNSSLSEEEANNHIEKKTYRRVKQCIQQFVFNLNVPSRWGTQTPFTNITLDWTCPEDLINQKAKIGGEPQEFTFGELRNEMDLVNKAFIEVMTAGDAKGRVFTFPIPTYNITKDFDWDDPKTDLLFEMTAKYGMPYFQNFINSDLKPGMIRSMCCRLQLDLRELLMRGNGLFGSAEMTGSIGVVTINTARLGYLFKGKKEALLKRLQYLMDLAKESLEIKRKVIQRNIDNGLLPFTKRYLPTLDNHFSTIGINGMNELIRNYTNNKHDISDEEGKKIAIEILDFMRKNLQDYQEETGNLYNLEATPAEGTTYRFAKEDQKRYEGIIQAGTLDAPYYTNSSQLPVNYTDDAFEALELQDELQKKYTGGTVLHLYMGERISNSQSCKKIVKRALENFKLPYITITPTFSICPKHGYLSGEHEFCPKCDEEIGYTENPNNHKNLNQKIFI
ncbi:MAG: Anaerobic ribonucleoside-triphosphate reductase [Candidatus Peregrinibacteria bacterium GW2011_GWA2_33_10]|nr:MAG: Anaerobic ribonucleoside-triphosphate reductase [Candidatus Peregrinibacteria bacterium GW2011_GWA2_33_10]KKP39279.1 MAG: anaerobic ribonucleoside triphosphate reductase, ribonucleoside-triphosphate reductase [Candidatus Peregrinibacteria bacterium GW2011_GWC2_33_13]OGJ49961.1 MAG: ribonucleoside triphosphate reductase [Candidatus Peregrinibacteria bacterium RIFOXYA2_FULL_33_7]